MAVNGSIMKKLVLILFIFSTLSISVKSQVVEAIGEIASGTLGFAGELAGSDGCCVDGCFFLIDPTIWLTFHYLNQDFLDRKRDEGVPFVRSVELSTNLAMIPNDLTIWTPQIRLNSGRWGMDFRVFHMREKRLNPDNPLDIYTTYDWQFLKYNIFVQHDWRLYIGTGMVWESLESGDINVRPEFSAGFDLYPDERIRLRAEGRLAADYANDRLMRRELTGTVSYLLNNNKSPRVYLNGNVLSARYYGEINFWSLGGGLSVEF